MKTSNILSLTLVILLLCASCSKEEHVKTGCDFEDWTDVTAQVGRVYKWTNSEPNYYYLGNTQASLASGGYIPCNGLPAEFKHEGLIVEFSGTLKQTAPGLDPLFVYINISAIKVAN